MVGLSRQYSLIDRKIGGHGRQAMQANDPARQIL
jgi:hypothetical protein